MSDISKFLDSFGNNFEMKIMISSISSLAELPLLLANHISEIRQIVSIIKSLINVLVFKH